MSELAIGPGELDNLLNSVDEMASDIANIDEHLRTQAAPRNAEAEATKHRADSNLTARPVQFAPLKTPSSTNPDTNLDLLMGVKLQMVVELGRTNMRIEEILKLGPGSVVELDKLAGEPVDVLVNNRLIARGEVVVIDDRFGVRITDVLPYSRKVKSVD
jgi:flagellar motor switch protein FliN/FliY